MRRLLRLATRSGPRAFPRVPTARFRVAFFARPNDLNRYFWSKSDQLKNSAPALVWKCSLRPEDTFGDSGVVGAVKARAIDVVFSAAPQLFSHFQAFAIVVLHDIYVHQIMQYAPLPKPGVTYL